MPATPGFATGETRAGLPVTVPEVIGGAPEAATATGAAAPMLELPAVVRVARVETREGVRGGVRVTRGVEVAAATGAPLVLDLTETVIEVPATVAW